MLQKNAVRISKIYYVWVRYAHSKTLTIAYHQMCGSSIQKLKQIIMHFCPEGPWCWKVKRRGTFLTIKHNGFEQNRKQKLSKIFRYKIHVVHVYVRKKISRGCLNVKWVGFQFFPFFLKINQIKLMGQLVGGLWMVFWVMSCKFWLSKSMTKWCLRLFFSSHSMLRQPITQIFVW